MPPQQRHLQQVHHNLALLGELSRAPMTYADWAITLVFYTALHLVDSYLAALRPSVHPDKNFSRQRPFGRDYYIEQHLPDLEEHYDRLYNASVNARYKVQCLTPFAAAYYQHHYVNHFAPIMRRFGIQQ